jgi:hypothetical protein
MNEVAAVIGSARIGGRLVLLKRHATHYSIVSAAPTKEGSYVVYGVGAKAYILKKWAQLTRRSA